MATSCWLSTTILKVAAVLIFLALLLHVIGVATPHWYSYDFSTVIGTPQNTDLSIDAGLFEGCSCNTKTDCDCTSITLSDAPDWHQATVALALIGLIALLSSLIITCVLLCTKQRRWLKILNICLLAFAGICILIAVIIYGAKVAEALDALSGFGFDYSFILCVIAVCLIFLLCLPFLIWDYCLTPKRRRNDRIRYSTKNRELFVEPQERYEPPPAVVSQPAYGYYEQPSYEPVRYGRQDYVAPYTTAPYTVSAPYQDVKPAYMDYKPSRPTYVDYRSTRPATEYVDYRTTRPATEYVDYRTTRPATEYVDYRTTRPATDVIDYRSWTTRPGPNMHSAAPYEVSYRR